MDKTMFEQVPSLSMAMRLFRIARSLYGRYGIYDQIKELADLENVSIELMCGTDNRHVDDYILRYYIGEIDVETLLDNLLYPREDDRIDGA
jgi:hypothetical protein